MAGPGGRGAEPRGGALVRRGRRDDRAHGRRFPAGDPAPTGRHSWRGTTSRCAEPPGRIARMRLRAPIVLPCDPACSVLRDAVVDVPPDGRIGYVGPAADAPATTDPVRALPGDPAAGPDQHARAQPDDRAARHGRRPAAAAVAARDHLAGRGEADAGGHRGGHAAGLGGDAARRHHHERRAVLPDRAPGARPVRDGPARGARPGDRGRARLQLARAAGRGQRPHRRRRPVLRARRPDRAGLRPARGVHAAARGADPGRRGGPGARRAGADPRRGVGRGGRRAAGEVRLGAAHADRGGHHGRAGARRALGPSVR